MTLGKIARVSAVRRWKLTGPAGAELDAIVAGLIDTGFRLECIEPRIAYRVDGDSDRLEVISEQFDAIDGFALAVELPTPGPVNLRATVAPVRPYRRTVRVHGEGDGAFGFVARAVDSRLVVTADGVSCWAVTGHTADLLAWLCKHVHQKSLDEVLALWSLTPEQAAAEDADSAALPPIRLVMPDRVVKTQEITRNDDGEIVEVIQTIKQVGNDEPRNS